jgi:hypothetical protein
MNEFSIVVVDGIICTYEVAKLIRKGMVIVTATQEEIKHYWRVRT